MYLSALWVYLVYLCNTHRPISARLPSIQHHIPAQAPFIRPSVSMSNPSMQPCFISTNTHDSWIYELEDVSLWSGLTWSQHVTPWTMTPPPSQLHGYTLYWCMISSQHIAYGPTNKHGLGSDQIIHNLPSMASARYWTFRQPSHWHLETGMELYSATSYILWKWFIDSKSVFISPNNSLIHVFTYLLILVFWFVMFPNHQMTQLWQWFILRPSRHN